MTSRDHLAEVLCKSLRGREVLSLVDSLANHFEPGWRLERHCLSGWQLEYTGTNSEAMAAYTVVTQQLELINVAYRVVRPDGSVDIGTGP